MAGVSTGEELAARVQDSCFVCGAHNPRGLQIRFQTAGVGRVEAEWRPPAEVEGYAGLVHGGVVAAVLDEAMSKAVAAAGGPGLTARLEVRYRRPTPSGACYRVVGEVERPGRRRLYVRARLEGPDGVVQAEAAACFIRRD